jgi:hypothetical protein
MMVCHQKSEMKSENVLDERCGFGGEGNFIANDTMLLMNLNLDDVDDWTRKC